MSILDKFKLDNRVAIVTGGNRGLGKEMAKALVEAGAKVAVVSRKIEEAQAAASVYGDAARGYGCDVAVPEQVEGMVSQVAADFGGIDIVVNNAGINIRRPIEELSLEEFQQVQNINVTGVWLVARAATPYLKVSNYGRLINIGSTLSLIALPGRTPYASSKGAVLQMTKALALEWAQHNITANAVLPGPFGTEMNLPLMEDPEKYQDLLSLIPLGRWGELDEIGGLIVFLASDAASFITGSGFTIDGGWTAR